MTVQPEDHQRERERLADMVWSLHEQKPWSEQLWAKAALATASRAIRRGRLLTEREKFNNLMRAMSDSDDEATR